MPTEPPLVLPLLEAEAAIAGPSRGNNIRAQEIYLASKKHRDLVAAEQRKKEQRLLAVQAKLDKEQRENEKREAALKFELSAAQRACAWGEKRFEEAVESARAAERPLIESSPSRFEEEEELTLLDRGNPITFSDPASPERSLIDF